METEAQRSKVLVACGLRIRALREGRGITFADVDNRGLITSKQLRRIEDGECDYTTKTIRALCRMYKVHPGRLFPDDYLKLLGIEPRRGRHTRSDGRSR